MENNRILKQFGWRFLLVRILVNALALAFTATILPTIYFVDRTFSSWVLMAIMLGILNALLKPLLQFLTLQFIFVTYGLVIVLVNALFLWMLSWLFPARFAAGNVIWLLVGGLVLGISGSFLESLLGLTMPVVSAEPPGLQRQLDMQARQVEWLASAHQGTGVSIPASRNNLEEQQSNVDEQPIPEGEKPPVVENLTETSDSTAPEDSEPVTEIQDYQKGSQP